MNHDNELNILAIIPARSGSKTVKDKNIRLINKKPMMAYSIKHALQSRFINRVIVTTDSEEYAQIAIIYGAEIPFLRPEKYAQDDSLDIHVFKHALETLLEKEHYRADIIVHLRPTYPIRNVEDIDNMIKLLLERKADSVRCIAPAKETPYKMWREDKDGLITPVLLDIKEGYNMPRQKLPKIYYQNACIDVINASTIMDLHSMTGNDILGYKMEENYDIDTEEDFRRAELRLELESGNHTFVFDIDGVIAKICSNLEYEHAQPNKKMITIINRLHSLGNKIILFTARGYMTGINWETITREQMKKWNVKFDELKFGKPGADFYIDDKSLSIEELYNIFD